MSVSKNTAARQARHACAGALLALAAARALADPADYVFTPYADIGRWQVAYGLGTEHDRDGSRETQQTLTLAGAPLARWYTALYAAWAAHDGGAFAMDEWSWLNHLQLTTPGAGPLDMGALCEASRPHDRGEGRLHLSCGPTLQMDTDDLQANLNLSLDKRFGGDESGRPDLGYQWQLKRLVAHGVELGGQGFGSVGAWNHWAPASEQQHTLGPAVFLKTRAFGGPVQFDAAWLLGVGAGSPRNVLRMRVRHEF
jgi:hypothetical protein